jgi:DNA/RNA endonuclease YhcR with UshA esterase domain
MRLLTLVAAVLLGYAASGQTTRTNAPLRVAASEARRHLNSEATVFGKVAEVNLAEKLVRLNFDHPYPTQTFTVVIFAARTNQFPNVMQLKNKTVEVTGRITEFRNRPEIILTRTNQLRIIETGAGTGRRGD